MTRFFPSLCLFSLSCLALPEFISSMALPVSLEFSITRPSPKWLVHFLLMMPSYSFFLSSMNRPVPLFIVLFLYDSSPSSVTHHLPLELIAFLRDTSLSSMTRPFPLWLINVLCDSRPSSITGPLPVSLAYFLYYSHAFLYCSLFFQRFDWTSDGGEPLLWSDPDEPTHGRVVFDFMFTPASLSLKNASTTDMSEYK